MLASCDDLWAFAGPPGQRQYGQVERDDGLCRTNTSDGSRQWTGVWGGPIRCVGAFVDPWCAIINRSMVG